MKKGVFGARALALPGLWRVVTLVDGAKRVTETDEPDRVCPHCGSLSRRYEPRPNGQYPTIRCGDCGEDIGWAGRLAKPCRDCDMTVKEWTARDDGKVVVTCRMCGRFEAYPD